MLDLVFTCLEQSVWCVEMVGSAMMLVVSARSVTAAVLPVLVFHRVSAVAVTWVAVFICTMESVWRVAKAYTATMPVVNVMSVTSLVQRAAVLER